MKAFKHELKTSSQLEILNDFNENGSILDDDMKNLLRSKEGLAIKAEIEEAIEFFEQVQSIKVPSMDLKRSKRQATSNNCTKAKEDLGKIQLLIGVLQQNITNVTSTLEIINLKVAEFQFKVSNSTGSLKTLNQNLLKTYTGIANSTNTSLKNFKNQLNTTLLNENQIKLDIQTYCFPTTTTTSKC